jgi:hypothetical protein
MHGVRRYNPAAANYDTSGGYYNMLTKSEQEVEEPGPRVLEAPIQELLRAEVGLALFLSLLQAEEDDDPCHQRKCTSNEHCCDGHVCVDTHNSGGSSARPCAQYTYCKLDRMSAELGSSTVTHIKPLLSAALGCTSLFQQDFSCCIL